MSVQSTSLYGGPADPAPTAPEPPRPREEHRLLIDFVLLVAVGLLSTLPYFGHRGLDTIGLNAFLASALIFRRTLPALAVGVATVAALGQLLVLSEPTISLIVVPILVYTVARWSSRGLGRVTVGLAVIGSVLGPLRWSSGYQLGAITVVYAGAMMAACAAGVSVFYVIGRRSREANENTAQRRMSEVERHRLMLAEQEQRARMAAVDERNRIARELHDIVAHSLSVIVVQAEGGKALAGRHPERAPEVLGTIAETSREALEEMRRMVGLLRDTGEPERAAYLPTPGLTDLPDLVRKTSATAGFSTYGTLPRVSPALGLTAYRIVQESLTNVLKHAGPAAVAQVRVAYTPASIELEILDDGRGAAATSDGLGHGLRGMRERVVLHGGTMAAQARPGGGFSVRVSLPYAAEPSIPQSLDRLRLPGPAVER